MRFLKVREVKSPQKAYPTDAGIDFFVPEYDRALVYELLDINKYSITAEIGGGSRDKHFCIHPHASVKIPLGVKVVIPEGYALVAFNRSSVAAKRRLILGACVIDEGYRGEIFLNLINLTKERVKVFYGEKVVQSILLPISSENLHEISEKEFSEVENTARGEGGFGSTGR